MFETWSFSGVNSLCKHASTSLKHDFQKCWYKEIEDSTIYLFYRHFKTAHRQTNKKSFLPDVYVISDF